MATYQPRKEGRKEGREEGRKERMKEGTNQTHFHMMMNQK
jgi:hypothetical protein